MLLMYFFLAVISFFISCYSSCCLSAAAEKKYFFVVQNCNTSLRCTYILLVPSSSKISSRYYGWFMNAPNCQNLLTLVGKLQKNAFSNKTHIFYDTTTCFFFDK